MIRKDYVPREESSQLTWAQALMGQAGIPANQTAMSWSTTDASQMSGAADNITNAILSKETARAAYLSAVASADALVASALAVIRPLVSSGKDSPLYTTAVGQLLGVIGAEVEFNPETYKAELREVASVGNATLRIKFAKALGELDAARLFTRHAGAMTWTVATTMVRSPFLHHMTLATPGVPESLEVRIRGIIGNEEIGEYSDIVAVTLT